MSLFFKTCILLLITIFQNSNTVILYACCGFQSSFSGGKCIYTISVTKPFPTSLTVGSGFNSSNQFQLKFRKGSRGSVFGCSDADMIIVGISPEESMSRSRIFSNGYLQRENMTLPPSEFCINRLFNNNKHLELFACKQNCQSVNQCLPKCCPWGQSPRWLHPNLCYSRKGDWSSNLIPKLHIQQHRTAFYYHNKLNCIRDGKMVATSSINIFNVSQMQKITKSLQPGSYCIDDVINSHDMEFNWNRDQAIFYCGDHWPIDKFGLNEIEKVVYGICLVVSGVFLVIVIVIYYIKLHRTHSYVHTWIEFFYMISLFGFGTFFGLHAYFPEVQEQYCTLYHFMVVFGYIVFGVSLFSWASLLSIDLFIAFKVLRPLGLEMATRDVKRLAWYCVIGFSFPLLVTISSFSYSYAYWKEAGYCLPLQFKAIRTIQGGLLLINAFFFFGTFYLICHHRRTAKFATKRSKMELNQLVSCFVKLFIVSGITYGGVIFSYVFGTERDASWYLILFRIFLNLRGVTVFFIYACNPQMKKLLLQRYQEGIFCGCAWCRHEPPRNVRKLSTLTHYQHSTLKKPEEEM